jgi:5'-AMP-activated protein kinase, catalytic alpha subunit
MRVIDLHGQFAAEHADMGTSDKSPRDAAQSKMQDVNQTAEFFLSNYRLGKTLGIGSFGKVWGHFRHHRCVANVHHSYLAAILCCLLSLSATSYCPATGQAMTDHAHGCLLQVKVAEHILTGHKVAIKILNRRKIKQMDMEEKGRPHLEAQPDVWGSANI